jgi:hypothetical protein
VGDSTRASCPTPGGALHRKCNNRETPEQAGGPGGTARRQTEKEPDYPGPSLIPQSRTSLPRLRTLHQTWPTGWSREIGPQAERAAVTAAEGAATIGAYLVRPE